MLVLNMNVSENRSAEDFRPPQAKYGFVTAPKEESDSSILQFIDNLPPLKTTPVKHEVFVPALRKKGINGTLVWNRLMCLNCTNFIQF